MQPVCEDGKVVEVIPIHLADQDIPLVSLLSPEERNRAARFLRSEPRYRYISGRVALRTLLGARLGIRPQDVPIRLTVTGKPFLPGDPLHFSLSHSGKVLLCAISPDSPVGVDVERLVAIPEMQSIARQHFAAEEWGENPQDLIRSWTRREAYIKALGAGLGSQRLSGIRFADSTTLEGAVAVLNTDAQWYVHDVVPLEGYVASVCYRGSRKAITIHPIEPLAAFLESEVCQ